MLRLKVAKKRVPGIGAKHDSGTHTHTHTRSQVKHFDTIWLIPLNVTKRCCLCLWLCVPTRNQMKHFDTVWLIQLNVTKRCCLCRWLCVHTDSPSRGGDVVVYAFDINQPSLPTPFYSLFCSCVHFVFMALSTVFHSINSLDNSPLYHSVFPVLFLPYISQLYISLWKSPSALIKFFVTDWS